MDKHIITDIIIQDSNVVLIMEHGTITISQENYPHCADRINIGEPYGNPNRADKT